MKQYLDLLRLIRETGVYKQDRTGTGTYSIFAHQMRFDLSNGQFPLVTTKKCHLKSIVHELLWFLQGDTNIRYLKENGVNIWDSWVKEGTAEYVDLSLDELKKAFVARFKDHGAKEVGQIYINSGLTVDVTFSVDVYKCVHFSVSKEFANTINLLGDTLEVAEAKCLKAVAEFYGLPTQKLVAGELGPVYGSRWRSWPTAHFTETELSKASGGVQGGGELKIGAIDQIANLVDQLKRNPDSRRLIVSAWDPAVVEEQALPPCHCLFQFYTAPMSFDERKDWYSKTDHSAFELLDRQFAVRIPYNQNAQQQAGLLDDYMCSLDVAGVPSRKLSCQLYQRSADCGIGLPFNIASYALLTMMVAQVTNMVPSEFIWTGGDCHLYSNHLEQVDLQLTREPHPLPTMKINPDIKDIFGFTFDDFELVDYTYHPHIAMPIAV